MAREDAIKVEATVIEALPNKTVRVELSNGHRFLAFLSGKLRMSFTRLIPGDRVKIEMSPYDLSKGCIVDKTG
jgi:translation initiation factor IF-1